MSSPSDKPIRGRRLDRCVTCGLSAGLCECGSLVPLAVRTEVVVVVHPLERFKSTNTGRLAAHVLSRGTLRIAGPREKPPARPGTYVLFPREDAIPLEQVTDLTTLIVPDGTWPQAGKIARRDPLCVGLPHVALASSRKSIYPLRRSERPFALSTYEAIAEVLRTLEGDAVADAMHAIFARWALRSLQVRRGAHARLG